MTMSFTALALAADQLSDDASVVALNSDDVCTVDSAQGGDYADSQTAILECPTPKFW